MTKTTRPHTYEELLKAGFVKDPLDACRECGEQQVWWKAVDGKPAITEEVLGILDYKQQIEVICEFCGETWTEENE